MQQVTDIDHECVIAWRHITSFRRCSNLQAADIVLGQQGQASEILVGADP